MMRILFDNEIFSRQRFGGISRYFYEIISRIASGKQACAELFLGINNSGFEFSFENVNVESINVIGANKFHLALDPLNKILFNKFSRKNEFNIFHKTYYSSLGLNVKKPIISTIHDMTHEILPEYFAAADNTSSVKKNTVNSSAGIICVSDNTKNDLLNLYKIDESKIKVIYHGLTLRNSLDAKPIVNFPYILYVGQRWGYKNFNILLKAYSSSNEIKNNLKILCFGGGKFTYSERVILKELDLTDKIIHISGNDKMLVSAYKFAEMLVYTSLYEGFGFPPLEAMQCSCPVITSPAGSVKEISGESALYYEPYNSENLIHSIKLLLNDSTLKMDLIAKGKETVKKYDWDKSASEHISFYKKFI